MVHKNINWVVIGIIHACHAYFHIHQVRYLDDEDEWFGP